MKTTALTTTVFALTAATLLAQGGSDIEFLRARADAQERKISQLEKELIHLKSYHDEKAAPRRANPIASNASTAKAGVYVVKKGDSLSRIARRNKTTVAALKKENGLRSDRLSIGQKLRVPSAAAPAPRSVAKKPAVAAASTPSVAGKTTKHTVKNGETFYSIARTYKVSMKSLMAANPKVKPSRMRVGQSLVINGKAQPKKSAPVSRLASAPKRKSKPRPKAAPKKLAEYVDSPKPKAKARTKDVARNAPADKKRAQSTPKSSTPAQDSSEPSLRTITVHQQMTYGQFASKHGASTTQLNALNGLSLNKNTMLAKGSELYVPKY